MSTSKFVSRLSSRLQPIALKFNNKSISSLQSSTPLLVSVCSRRLSRSSRLPLQLSCVGSMMPLHSAIALSRLISSLSNESDSWALVPQGCSALFVILQYGFVIELKYKNKVSQCLYDSFKLSGGELAVDVDV